MKEVNKIVFLIGHTEKDKGAFSPHLKKSEWQLFKDLETELTKIGDVFYHDPKIKSYRQRQTETAKLTYNYKTVIELHFNSLDKEFANGAEVLYYFNSARGKFLATNFLELWCERTEIKNRGAKAVNLGNGGEFLKKTKGTALLLEPFFGSNAEDCSRWNEQTFIDVLKDFCNKL
jgi:N-acetylmuramoyl-L-alanine amidase